MKTRYGSRRDRRAVVLARSLSLLAGLAGAGVSTAYADVIREDFSSGIPSSWTHVDYRQHTSAPSGIAWGITSPSTYDNYTGGEGLAAMADSDSAGDGVGYDIGLLTPRVSLPNEAGLTASFISNYQNMAHSDFADVDIRVGDSDVWTTLMRWNEDHGDSFRNRSGELVELNLDAFAGQDVQFRFHYYDPNMNGWNWYWQVDNFIVTPAPGAATLGVLAATTLLRRRRR